MSLVRYTHIHARARARFYYHTMCEGDIFLRQKKKEKGKKRKKKRYRILLISLRLVFSPSLPPSLSLPFPLQEPRASWNAAPLISRLRPRYKSRAFANPRGGLSPSLFRACARFNPPAAFHGSRERAVLINHIDAARGTLPPRAAILLMHLKLINVKAAAFRYSSGRIDLGPLSAY